MPPRPPIRISAYTAVSALGAGKAAHLEALRAHRSGLTPLGPHDFGAAVMAQELDTWVGHVEGLKAPLPDRWAHWDCRTNRLAWQGLLADGMGDAVRAAVLAHGAQRVAVVLGSSTASIGATEDAYQGLAATGHFPPQPDNPRLHTLHSLVGFVQEALGVQGPGLTVSTACSSSAKAFASAERLLALDLADAVLVGGVDSLCGSVVFGFNALQLVSPEPCRPFDTARRGINLGEAAGFALLERGPGHLQLLGCGESSDAHHLSAPHPGGLGALAALDQALARAQRSASEIDYLHTHGTATPHNDCAEAALIAQRFSVHTAVSSTKGATGHTLGAAGAIEAVICAMALIDGRLPGSPGTQQLDPAIDLNYARHGSDAPLKRVLSNSFGFGGSNCSLILGVRP